MRTIGTSSLILVLAVLCGASADDPPREPWFVRAALVSLELPCKGAFVQLSLSSSSSEPLLIPIESVESNDAEWWVEPLRPGVHELLAQVVSCSGVAAGPLVTLEFEHSVSNRRKEIYLGLRSRHGAISLDYLEIATSWDGSAFVSIDKDGDAILVTNISDVPLHRCEYEWAEIYEEFLVEGVWDVFDKGGQREWPEDLAVLKPGETVRMTSPPVFVVTKRSREPRVVRPAAKRYTLTVQPMRQSFVTLTEPQWAPVGLPSCDRFSLEQPATENDPSLKVWD